MSSRSVVSWFCALSVACSAEPLTTGLEEPLRVQGAQFREGLLPGLPPFSIAELSAGALPVPPFPTPPEVAGRILSPLEVGFTVAGRASTDTYAIGFQLNGLGTGYWLIPVSAPDPINAGELTWRAELDLGSSVPAGLRSLRVAALDRNGLSGSQQELELCVRSSTADNLNACDPTLEPPALVVSLSWDGDADLDLSVVAEDGSSIDRSNTLGTKGGTRGAQLERDANSDCESNGAPRENVVWQGTPEPGLYAVYVNLHTACGERSVEFKVTTHETERIIDTDQFRQVETSASTGVLLELHANGGTQRGLRITEIQR